MPAPIITCSQMRDWEQRTWAAKRTPFEVISRVGHILTARIRQLTRPGDAILVLAGKGHNGDDARQIVTNLKDREVTLLNALEPRAALKEFNSLLSVPQTLIVDGIFGIGLHGTLSHHWQKLVNTINNSGVPVLAVDVPSGLHADSGLPQGAAIQASITITLGAPKQGLVQTHATPYVGRLEVAPDIGLVPCPIQGNLRWTLPEDFSGFPPPRPVASHKGSHGHLIIVAGSLGYHGAAVLTARGAQSAQPGLITLITPEESYLPAASQLQAVMVRPWQENWSLPSSATCILAGPGLADASVPESLRHWITTQWQQSHLPMVADASALPWLRPSTSQAKALRILTPHPGEAAQLLKTDSNSIQSDRPKALHTISRRFSKAWVILKGHQTLVGQYRSPIFINSSGNPNLAQGGSGDLLAGFLAGLLAQPTLQHSPETTLRYAVWQHGHQADQLSHTHPRWTIEELASHLHHNP
jgi:NAD(P)H-hydrate epimerase